MSVHFNDLASMGSSSMEMDDDDLESKAGSVAPSVAASQRTIASLLSTKTVLAELANSLRAPHRKGGFEGIPYTKYMAYLKALTPGTYTRGVNKTYLKKSPVTIPLPQIGMSFDSAMKAAFAAGLLLIYNSPKDFNEREFIAICVNAGGGLDAWNQFLARRASWRAGTDKPFQPYIEKMAELNCLRYIIQLRGRDIPRLDQFMGRLLERSSERRHFLNGLCCVNSPQPIKGNINYVSRILMINEFGVSVEPGMDYADLLGPFMIAAAGTLATQLNSSYYYETQFLAIRWIAEALVKSRGNIFSDILRRLNTHIWWSNKSYSF